MQLEAKNAVVTGAGGGMGRAIAKRLAAEGASVVLLDRKAAPPDLAPNERYLQGDLTDDAFVAEAIASFDRIDHVVNAAGVLWFDRDCSVLDIDLAVWDEVIAINLTAVARVVRHAVPRMGEGAAMVHVSSTQALRGDDKPQDAYQVSKAAIIALSKSLAIQLAPRRIRSNVLVPGPTATPMQARWKANPAGAEAVAGVIPLGRVGTADDMAEACLFLLSDRAAFITGTELLVDGGLLARP